MRWEDERYVRVYTRDTTTMLRIGWEGRALLVEILRKVDRAGILTLEDPVVDLAVMLRMPEDVVERALAALTRGTSPCVVVHANQLLVPNFIEAQEAKQSDKQRKAESRSKARDVSAAIAAGALSDVTNRDQESQNVTECPPGGQNVTAGHSESQRVTAGHSVLSRAVPCLTVPDRAVPTGPDKKSEPSAPRGATVEKLLASIAWPLGTNTPKAHAALASWVGYQRARKKTIVAQTLEQILEKYFGRIDELERDVKHSIAMGWTGLFAPDGGNGRSGRNGEMNPNNLTAEDIRRIGDEAEARGL
jgi:hypothetical protein